jgi:hypothetical protein
MRELKMKRFKNYAAKLRATIRQIKHDGGSSMGVTREDIAQHVGGGDKKKEKVSCSLLRFFFASFLSPPISHPCPTEAGKASMGFVRCGG